MKLNLYDEVMLKNGNRAYIVEIYNNGEAFEADIDTTNGTITDTIYPDDIEH